MSAPKILFVSDVSPVSPALSRFLVDVGYQVTSVRNRRAALSALRTGDYPLVIVWINGVQSVALGLLKSIKAMNLKTTALILRGRHGDHRAEATPPVYLWDDYQLIPGNRKALHSLVSDCLSV